jgi:hypothetical protein
MRPVPVAESSETFWVLRESVRWINWKRGNRKDFRHLQGRKRERYFQAVQAGMHCDDGPIEIGLIRAGHKVRCPGDYGREEEERGYVRAWADASGSPESRRNRRQKEWINRAIALYNHAKWTH